MKFLYHIPSLHSIGAARVYVEGYKNAILDMGHEFKTLTTDDDQESLLINYRPDVFVTSLNDFNLKYLDLSMLSKAKKSGTKVFVNAPFWRSPFSKLRVNEAKSLANNIIHRQLIKSGKFGDIYYNIGEQGDPRMDGFEKATGYKHYTLPLAADKTYSIEKPVSRYKSDLAFIGTFLPGRRQYMREQVFPLLDKYNVKLFCQDLTVSDRFLNTILKVGQYFNVPYLKSFKKNNVTFLEERQIFASTLICLNIHEDYQRDFGMDCNDRTFKIPLYGGFELTDDVACIRKYFLPDKEIIIAESKKDWFEKIEYYLKNPEKRLPIIRAGRKRVLKDHTYHQRVKTLLNWYKELNA